MLRMGWNYERGTGALQTKADTGALDDSGALDTLVLISLFTDAEATPAEIAAAGLNQQRGWWADADSVRPADTHRLGSKLWLLSREKLNLATRRRAETYPRESPQWLIDRGMASAVTVKAASPRPGWLALEVSIERASSLLPRYSKLWEVPFAVTTP